MKVKIENLEPHRKKNKVSMTFFLLILILLFLDSRMKGQEPDSSCDHPKFYSINVQIGLNQIKEMNLLPLVNKGILTDMFDNFNELADLIIKSCE